LAVFLIIRMFGAWMLRINEIIDLQRDTLKELKRINPTPPDEPRSPDKEVGETPAKRREG